MEEDVVQLKQRVDNLTKTLSDSEGRFRNVILNNADGMVIVDTMGIIRFANPAAEAIFCRKAEELVGTAFAFPVTTGTMTEVEILGPSTGHGMPGTVFAEMRVIETEWEDKPAFLASLRDITSRKFTERDQRESEQTFFKIFRATPAMLTIASLEQGKFIEVNETCERVCGYRREELIGRTGMDLHIWQNPDDRNNVIRMLHNQERVRDLEINFRNKSGKVFLGLYSAEIIILHGEPYLLSLVKDITARKETEKALQESEQRYRLLFENNPTPMWVYDLETLAFLAVNEAAVVHYGYSRQEFLRMTIKDIRPEEDIPALLDKITQTAEDFDKAGIWRHRKKDGTVIMVEISTHSLTFGGRSAEVVMSHDITAQKRDKEEIEILNTNLAARAAELEIANSELESFSYTVSHDLRKPLTNINGYCQVILQLCAEGLSDRCRGFIQEIYEATLNMNKLIDTLLNFSLLTRDELHREAVDLSEIAQDIAAGLQMMQPERNVTFDITPGIVVNGDAKLLRILLENLLGNAWKYTSTKRKASIEFGLNEGKGETVCFVRDNGIGFDMADADKLFRTFQRLHSTNEFEGFGIGLATVQRIIKHHGGRVWAEGVPNGGAIFYFTL